MFQLLSVDFLPLTFFRLLLASQMFTTCLYPNNRLSVERVTFEQRSPCINYRNAFESSLSFYPCFSYCLSSDVLPSFFFFGSFLLSFPHLSSISHTATKMSVFGNTDLRMAASNLETPAPINTPLVCSHIKNVDIAFQFLLLAAD